MCGSHGHHRPRVQRSGHPARVPPVASAFVSISDADRAPGRAAVLGGAAALLHPLGFEEPFGLSVVEAMACGTPVIGYPRGVLPETVEPCVTGFLVDGVESAAAAVPAALRLDRSEVSARARARFSADRMVDDYLRVYKDVT